MNAVAGAAVPVLPSLDFTARVSSNVTLCLSVHSSPSPASLKNLNSRACRYKSRSRRRIAKATASSFSIGLDNEEEELGYSYEGADVLQSVSRRNATRKFEREESASKSRGVKAPFDKHQTRGSFYSENAPTSRKHDRDNAVAYNRERDFPPFEEQQHHGSFWGKKHSRVPLPTKNQCLRMHNKVTVFEGIRQPSVSGLSSNNRTDASSWGVEDADVAPNFDGQPLISHEDSRRRLRYSQCTTQHGFKENIQRSSQFMSKLEEVVSNLKKKDVLSRERFAMNQEVLRDESMQAAINEGKRSKGRGLFEFSKSIEKQSGKFAEFDIKSSAGNANIIIASGGSNVMNDGKDLQNEPGETRSLSKEIASVGNEAAVTSFNLFSSSPAVPWESDRKYVSMFKPHIPIRRGYASPLARRSFRSIGSRSSPSRSSLTNRNDSHLELDSHAATGVLDLSKLIGGDEQMESWFEDREGSELNDDKFTTQTASQKEALEAEERAESINFYQSESDAEENGDNALSMHLSIKESCTEANATTNSSLSASSSNGIVNWDNSDSEVNEDKDFLIKADVEEDVSNEFDFHERSHHSQKNYVYSCDSDVEDAEPPEEVLVSSITHTNAPSAEFPADTNLGVSEMGNGSKHLISASWHKHNLADIPFEFQFSYSETPKVPVLGFRETPYSPFGPDTMGRPWTGGPPPKPSKKKQRVFDSFKPPPKDKKGIKYVQDPGPYPEGQGPKPAQSREEIMGDPLTKEEIVYLVEKCERESRQLNLGRDGLTHNMLDVIHCHWKRRRVCKIKCKGVPTVDMDNVKFHIEDKTGGKVIYQAGGVLYLFRGRNYNYKDRPQIPLMLWKPVTPLYPKLIQPAPEGLTKDEAHQLRVLGRKVQPMCRLGKNGVYLNLVKDVRAAFKVDELVRIDCRGLNPRDYKKIGAKLKDLVPCVLLSFDKEHILMWKGKQDLSVENVSLLNAPNSEPCLADGESFKQSSVTNEGDDCSICEEKVNISVYETLYSAHASGSDTEEKMCISYSEQESGSMLDYASEEVSTHSSDAEAASVLEATGCQVQFEGANINETVFSSSAKDEDHAFIARMKETDYSSNPGSLKEEKLKVSAEKVNVSLLGDKIPLDMSDVLSECHAIADGKLQRKTASKGPDTTFEEQSKSVNPKLGEDGHKEVVPPEAASLKMGFMHEVVDGLASDEEEVDKSLDNQTDSVVHLDALWDHAFASGMAVELSEEGMDADLIVRKAAQLAKLAPLGPTYTIKLIHKLQLKQYEDRPDDILQIRFGRGRPQRILKKVVKRKSELPTLDVPGMGGLPVDELARLLAPKQTP